VHRRNASGASAGEQRQTRYGPDSGCISLSSSSVARVGCGAPGSSYRGSVAQFFWRIVGASARPGAGAARPVGESCATRAHRRLPSHQHLLRGRSSDASLPPGRHGGGQEGGILSQQCPGAGHDGWRVRHHPAGPSRCSRSSAARRSHVGTRRKSQPVFGSQYQRSRT
jgi:hypothetical protein